MSTRYLTPSEAAEALRVSTDTVLRLVASGDLAALRVSPRIIRIPAPAFEAYQAGRTPVRRRVVRQARASEPALGNSEPISEPEPV